MWSQETGLPLACLVYRSKKGHTIAGRHIEVLEKLLSPILAGDEVVLLGDVDYNVPEIQLWLETETDWQNVLRISRSLRPLGVGQIAHWIYPLEKQWVLLYPQIGITEADTDRVTLVGWWDRDYKRPGYLLRNPEGKYQFCGYYQRTALSENLVSDLKSRGSTST